MHHITITQTVIIGFFDSRFWYAVGFIVYPKLKCFILSGFIFYFIFVSLASRSLLCNWCVLFVNIKINKIDEHQKIIRFEIFFQFDITELVKRSKLHEKKYYVMVFDWIRCTFPSAQTMRHLHFLILDSFVDCTFQPVRLIGLVFAWKVYHITVFQCLFLAKHVALDPFDCYGGCWQLLFQVILNQSAWWNCLHLLPRLIRIASAYWNPNEMPKCLDECGLHPWLLFTCSTVPVGVHFWNSHCLVDFSSNIQTTLDFVPTKLCFHLLCWE